MDTSDVSGFDFAADSVQDSNANLNERERDDRHESCND